MMIFCHHDQSTEASVLVTRVVTPRICLSSPVNPLDWIMNCRGGASSRHYNIIHGVNIQLELYSQSSQHSPIILPKSSSFSGNWWCCSKRLQWLVKCVNYWYFVRCDVENQNYHERHESQQSLQLQRTATFQSNGHNHCSHILMHRVMRRDCNTQLKYMSFLSWECQVGN